MAGYVEPSTGLHHFTNILFITLRRGFPVLLSNVYQFTFCLMELMPPLPITTSPETVLGGGGSDVTGTGRDGQTGS